MPVVELAPVTVEVYEPTGRGTRIAESAELAGRGKAATSANAVVSAAPPPQAAAVAIVALVVELTRVSCGVAREPATLKGAGARAGPTPRRSTLFVPEPVTTNPAMRALPPVPTFARAERFPILPGGGGVGVGAWMTRMGAEEPVT